MKSYFLLFLTIPFLLQSSEEALLFNPEEVNSHIYNDVEESFQEEFEKRFLEAYENDDIATLDTIITEGTLHWAQNIKIKMKNALS